LGRSPQQVSALIHVCLNHDFILLLFVQCLVYAGVCLVFFLNLFSSRYRKEREVFEEMEKSDGERVTGSDTVEGTEERAIRVMSIVTTLSYVRTVKDKARGVWVTLTCYNCKEYGNCEKPQEAPIHLSKERNTMRAYLQDLLKRLEENHVNCAEVLTKKLLLIISTLTKSADH
jgi:hypothetical protein